MDNNNRQQPSQTATINVPFATAGGFTFNLNSIIAIDFTTYEAGAPDRAIELLLLGPHDHLFEGIAADEFYTWYLNLTGQNRIQPVKLVGVT